MTQHRALVAEGAPLSPERLARYARQLALPDFGASAQRRLANARVLVVGAGGLGSATVPYLAAAGIGTIGIADTDVVELSNLHRQVVHRMSDIGRKKLDSIAEAVAAIDPQTVVRRHEIWLDSTNILKLLGDYDLIVDGSDNFQTRYLTNDAATLTGKPLVWGAILGYGGQAGVAWAPEHPTYRDLFPAPPPPGTVPSCATGGVLPGVCAAIGAIISTETIKLITGIGQPLLGRITTYDALTGRFRELEYHSAKDAAPVTELIDYAAFCGVRGTHEPALQVTPAQPGGSRDTMSATELATLLSSGAAVQLIDIREPFERAITAIEPSELIPLGTLPDAVDRIRTDIPVVLYCHHGIRSASGLDLLHRAGFHNVRHLDGGIDAYAAQIDPAMVRY